MSESIRLYARLLLGSQFQGRASILGDNASNFTIHQLYLQELEEVIKRPEDIQDDIYKFQHLLKYARTPINLVVYPKCYMIPSDMNLKLMKGLVGYNNKIFIAPGDSKIGEITFLNKDNIPHHVKQHDPFMKTHPHLPTTLPTHLPTTLPTHFSSNTSC